MTPPRETTQAHFEVIQRDGINIVVSREYGIVVRGPDINAAIAELKTRMASADADFANLGLPLPGSTPVIAAQQAVQGRPQPTSRNAVIALSVAAIVAVLAIAAALPVVRFVSGFQQSISALVPQSSEQAGRSVIDFIIRFADVSSQITPEREQQLQSALDRIAKKFAPLVRTALDPLAAPQSSLRQDCR